MTQTLTSTTTRSRERQWVQRHALRERLREPGRLSEPLTEERRAVAQALGRIARAPAFGSATPPRPTLTGARKSCLARPWRGAQPHHRSYQGLRGSSLLLRVDRAGYRCGDHAVACRTASHRGPHRRRARRRRRCGPVAQRHGAATVGGVRRPRDRADFAAAHVLVRVCVAALTGAEPMALTVVQRCAECGAAHGPPVLAESVGVQISLPRTMGVRRCDRRIRACGCRCGTLRPTPDRARGDAERPVARGVAAADAAATPHHAFLRYWVRKEALVKVGRTRLEDLPGIDLSALPTGPLHELPRTGCWERWHILDWSDDQAGVVGSAATRAPAPVQFVRRLGEGFVYQAAAPDPLFVQCEALGSTR